MAQAQGCCSQPAAENGAASCRRHRPSAIAIKLGHPGPSATVWSVGTSVYRQTTSQYRATTPATSGLAQ